MKRLAECLILMILSILFILEPIAFANSENTDNVVIHKEDIKQYWLNYNELYKSILNEAADKGIGNYNNDSLTNINDLVKNARDVEISYDNINYLRQFVNKASKAVAQYPPIDVSQIDIASENLAGLFINQLLGLLAPFFTSTGGAISIIGMAILTLAAIPALPVIVVLALGAGIVGLLLGVVVGLPVALAYLAFNFLTGGGDNATAETASFSAATYNARDVEIDINRIDNYAFLPATKALNQDNNTGQGNAGEVVAGLIGSINDLLGGLTGSIGNIISIIIDNFTLITGIVSNITSSILESVSVAIPIFAIFAVAGLIIFALIGVLLALIILSPILLPALPLVLLFVALGLAIGGVGFFMFNRSLTPMSFDSVNMTFYDVINKSVASIKGDPLKHVDIIVRDILEFAKEAFGKDSYAYFDNLENSVLSVDLRTIDGIKKATDRILEFIPLIK